MTNPLLSVITGTWNRLDFLRSMIQSIRSQMPPSMTVEFVVCDGGSTDGTLGWLRAQSDVVLLEHGELRGALRAFTDAGMAARGDYCLISNDDVYFPPHSVIPAIAYLDAHPTCGAVAFADNRPAPGYPSDVFKTQTISARAPNGHVVSVPYVQVGMFPTWLAKRIGFWGADDPIMGRGRTYGGDNWLSARCYELGYSIDTLETCRVIDRLPPDTLRKLNHQSEQQNPGVYYKAYPEPPQIAAEPVIANPTGEHLRILYAPLFSPGYGRYKHGLADALSRVGMVYELDYVRYPETFVSSVANFQPHVILTQFHGADVITPDALAEARAYAPDAVVVNWCGDVYQDQMTAPEMLDLLRHVDLQLVVNADVLPVYAALGIPAAYWQIAAEPVSDVLPFASSHDLLFMANAYHPERLELEAVLREITPNVGLYGYGWRQPTGATFYKFDEGAALYRNCKIAIGDNLYGDKGFVSNRLFEALANGAFLLHQTIPGLEELTGLRDGVHYVAWRDYEDLRGKAQSYLRNEAERRRIAQQGEAFVRKYHSFDVRVRELFQLIEDKVGQHERTEPVGAAEGMELFADGIPR